MVWYPIPFYNFKLSRPILKQSLPGLYSGVFALYLHYAAKKGTTGYTAIVFYALCVLYILTGVVVAVDMLVAVLADFLPSNVSNNELFVKNFCANRLCTDSTTSHYSSAFRIFSQQYSVAATSSPNLS